MKLGSRKDVQSFMNRSQGFGYRGEIREINGKTTAKFSYDGKIDAGRDRVINLFAKSHKLKWYAQGYSVESDERDICFDLMEG